MFRNHFSLCAALLVGLALSLPAPGLAANTADKSPATVSSLRIRILSTMLADGDELGEWGFAALVEVDGHSLLFDTGAHAELVRNNAASLGLSLSQTPELILSHSHWDHLGGLITLRKAVATANPSALSLAHVAEGFFYPRPGGRKEEEAETALALKPAYEALGGHFVSHSKPVELYPGVWLLGPIPRPNPEHNWSGKGTIETPQGVQEDTVPEDTALVFNTTQGLVVLTGCGHAGVVNIAEYARQVVRPARIHALIGGLHLFQASDETLRWTGGRLMEIGVDNLLATHCTGIEPLYRLRTQLGLQRTQASVGAVGAGFELGRGIDPRAIAR